MTAPVTTDAKTRIVRTVVQSVAAAIVAAPVVIGALGLSAARATEVEGLVATLVAIVSAAQNVGEDLGVWPSWLRFALPAPVAPVPTPVGLEVAKAEQVAQAVATVKAAAKDAAK